MSSDNALLAALHDPKLQGPGMRAIVVVQDGRIIAETYGEGFDASTPLQGWSMTKTVNAALVGMAIKDGKLSLDQKNLFTQWAGDARADISVADLMAMTSGLKWSEDGNSPIPIDWKIWQGMLRLSQEIARLLRRPERNSTIPAARHSVGPPLAECDRSERTRISTRAIVQAFRYDQCRSRIRPVRYISWRRISFCQCA